MNRRDSGDMVTGHGSRVAFLGVFLLLTSGCAAAGAYSATSAGPPKPIREVLPNGVVLIVQEHRHDVAGAVLLRSEEHTSELQSRGHLVCRLLLEKKKKKTQHPSPPN